MWVFTPFGLLMPALRPERTIAKGDNRVLQVRARDRRHLKHFRENYMDPGTAGRIISTPSMDYNYRFYCTREAFAEAMSKVILEIDFTKFKPTAERYAWGKEYHNVLNDIWSIVCKLGSPGGVWGKYSRKNPNGYKPGKYSTVYSSTTGRSLDQALRGTQSSNYDGWWNTYEDSEVTYGNETWLNNVDLESEEGLYEVNGRSYESLHDMTEEDFNTWMNETPSEDRHTPFPVFSARPSRKERRESRRQARRSKQHA